ncbi:UDP-N-acetylmuramate--L-alanine ligase [soil metagenome]
MKHLYLVGIGGVGMLWIADYALSMGWQLSGTDMTETDQVRRLRAAGATIHIGVDPAAIPEGVTEAVITAAITEKAPHYPELLELEKRGIPVSKRAVWIGKLTKRYTTIAVAGAHGKTTTTGMIGWILDQAGLDPTVFVGSTLAPWGGTRVGKGEYLVLEADEFDRSFHQFHPQVAVVLNIDADHLDYYTGGLPEIEQAYRKFLGNLPTGVHDSPKGKGLVVGYGKDGKIRKAAKGFKYTFRWYDETKLWPGLKLPQPGMHNLLNATAAARVCHELGVSQEVILKALASFPGAQRRFENCGLWGPTELYDDYAHHPTELRALLSGIHDRFPHKGEHKVTVVFQPHQKARTKNHLAAFGRAFDEHPVDQLILAPIYFVAGREDDIAITSEDLYKEILKRPPVGMGVTVAADVTELESLVRAAVVEGGILFTVGAGDIRNMVQRWQRG